MILFKHREEQRAVTVSDFFDRVGAGRALTGERVNYDSVISLDAAAAAVGLLSDMVSMLPVDTFRDDRGAADPMVSDPQLVADPSSAVSPRMWRAQCMVSWLLWGNAYGWVVDRDGFGHPTHVEWLDPVSVSIEESSPGAPLMPAIYRVDGRQVPSDRILHAPGRYVRPGSRIGIAPLERFTETFGLALAARNFGARWFGDGAHPSAVLQSDQQINEDQAKTIKRRFLEAVRGRREPAVLGAGLTYTPIQSTPAESQMIDAQAHSVAAVARAFGLPPEMIGAAVTGSKSIVYTNREQRAIDFLVFSLDPWLVRFEEMLTRNLPQRQYVKFNRGALLRTDLFTRYQAHDLAIRGGWRSVNEVRALEDEAPIANGDQHLWPPFRTNIDPERDDEPVDNSDQEELDDANEARHRFAFNGHRGSPVGRPSGGGGGV